jgi:hypothetical protein
MFCQWRGEGPPVAVRRRGGSGASRCYKDETHLFGVVCLVEVNFGSRAKYIGTDSGAHWSLIKGLPLIRVWEVDLVTC